MTDEAKEARESLRRIANSDLPYSEYARRALAELDDESANETKDDETTEVRQ